MASRVIMYVLAVLTSYSLAVLGMPTGDLAITEGDYVDQPDYDYSESDVTSRDTKDILQLVQSVIDNRKAASRPYESILDDRGLASKSYPAHYTKKELSSLLSKLSSTSSAARSLAGVEQKGISNAQKRDFYGSNSKNIVLTKKGRIRQYFGVRPPMHELCDLFEVRCF